MSAVGFPAEAGPCLRRTAATSDILFDRSGDAADAVDIGSVKPLVRPNREVATKPGPAGSPLWSVPRSVLTATQERPIFLVSRRPPQSAVLAARPMALTRPSSPARRPEWRGRRAVKSTGQPVTFLLTQLNSWPPGSPLATDEGLWP
jgi:hypothetical protein